MNKDLKNKKTEVVFKNIGENIMNNKMKMIKKLTGITKLSKTKELILELILLSNDALMIEGLTADKIAQKLNIKETTFLSFSSKLGRMGLINKFKACSITSYDLCPMLDSINIGE